MKESMEAAKEIDSKSEYPSYDVVVTTPDSILSETVVRRVARHQHAQLHSIVKRGAQRADLRMATPRVYDVVIALEAVGMEVVRVVAAPAR